MDTVNKVQCSRRSIKALKTNDYTASVGSQNFGNEDKLQVLNGYHAQNLRALQYGFTIENKKSKNLLLLIVWWLNALKREFNKDDSF